DPSCKVLVSADSLAFVDDCLKAGLGDALDGIVIHPYRGSAAPEAPAATFGLGSTGDLVSVFDASRAWLDAHRRSDAGIWATEIGWAVSGDDWPTVSVETHGRFLARTYLMAQGSGKAAN